jgi:diguanylate cyclase (GGDEF)-like protein
MQHIRQIMATEVKTIGRTAGMPAIIARLHDHRIGSLVVVNDKRAPIGIVTERDIIRSLAKHGNRIMGMCAQEVMSAPVITLHPDENVNVAADVLVANRIKRIPVVAHGRLVGLVSYRDINRSLRKQNTALTEKAAQLEKRTIHDDLTGLYTRRYVSNKLDYHLYLARQTHQALAVLMMDIDHFKLVNDTHGHPAGDYVLRELGRLLNALARSASIVGRYGGEEFILVAQVAGHEQARGLAERLRRAVQEHAFTYEGTRIAITISIGVAVWERGPGERRVLIKQADEALYAAKRNGRNRVEVAGPEVKIRNSKLEIRNNTK